MTADDAAWIAWGVNLTLATYNLFALIRQRRTERKADAALAQALKILKDAEEAIRNGPHFRFVRVINVDSDDDLPSVH